MTPLRPHLRIAPLALLVALVPACASGSAVGSQTVGEPGPAPRGEVAPPTTSTAAPQARRSWEGTTLSVRSDDDGTVVVSGVGRVEVEPDRAVISFAVETEGETALEASQANARRMEAVMTAVRGRGAGIPGFRMETSGYSVSPRYRGVRDGEPVIVGYTARNSVVVTLDDVTAVGSIMDTALEGGANRMSGLQFRIREVEPHRHEALRQATARARGEAEVLAGALGLRLGPPVEVQGGADYSVPPMFRAEMARAVVAMDTMEATPVEAGLQTVTAQVTIRFRLVP